MSEDDINRIEARLRTALPGWVERVDEIARARKAPHGRRIITTFETFVGAPQLVHDALAYAQAHNVDVMMTAHSNGEIF